MPEYHSIIEVTVSKNSKAGTRSPHIRLLLISNVYEPQQQQAVSQEPESKLYLEGLFWQTGIILP